MGLVHIYTGDGKGKTTAAIGLATRFLGQEGHVVLAQFLKGQETGEVNFLEKEKNIKIFRLEKNYGFTFSMDEETKVQVKKEHRVILNKSLAAVTSDFSGERCLLILDECAGAISTDLLQKEDILKLIELAKEHFELVLTGREFPKEILDQADYISEIKCVKHPMNQGIMARKGIEY